MGYKSKDRVVLPLFDGFNISIGKESSRFAADRSRYLKLIKRSVCQDPASFDKQSKDSQA